MSHREAQVSAAVDQMEEQLRAVSMAIFDHPEVKNEEFFALYRSLNAYRGVFGSREDMLILQPDSDFFRYFNDRRGSQ